MLLVTWGTRMPDALSGDYEGIVSGKSSWHATCNEGCNYTQEIKTAGGRFLCLLQETTH